MENKMSQYWVKGGEYTTTKFDQFADGKTEERYGPFTDYKDAYRVWQDHARATMDFATVRYTIDVEDHD